eukprot:3332261-Karenia_brevis.AAC.1
MASDDTGGLKEYRTKALAYVNAMINNGADNGGKSIPMDLDNLEEPKCEPCGGGVQEEELQLLRNQCAKCWQTGHWKNECPHTELEANKLKAQAKGSGGGRKGAGKAKGEVVCYKCGGYGHLSWNCPSS